MSCHIDLTPGAARRGGGSAIWPEIPPIYVSPDSLRPGDDLVRVCVYGAELPHGTWCLYLGHNGGQAVVLREGGNEAIRVNPWILDEPEYLSCTTVDPYDFLEGWSMGRFASAKELSISTQTKGQQPDAYGRGVTKGFHDQEHGRIYRPGSWVPYNELVRDLAVRFPGEHFAPTLRRRRELMAVASA